MIFKFILPIIVILSGLKCSSLIENEKMKMETLQLTRQTNSPKSQRLLEELVQRSRRNSAETPACEVSIHDAWIAYEDGNKDILMNCVRKGDFDPNQLIVGEKTILISAILKGDLELVKEVLKLPGIDVNFMDNSGLLPIELALSHPEIFDVLLSTGVNLLARTIRQALKEDKLEMAARMLREVGIERNLREREEFAELEKIILRNLRMKQIKNQPKIKKD